MIINFVVFVTKWDYLTINEATENEWYIKYCVIFLYINNYIDPNKNITPDDVPIGFVPDERLNSAVVLWIL